MYVKGKDTTSKWNLRRIVNMSTENGRRQNNMKKRYDIALCKDMSYVKRKLSLK